MEKEFKDYKDYNEWLSDVQRFGFRMTFFYPLSDEELSFEAKNKNIFNIESFFDYYVQELTPREAILEFMDADEEERENFNFFYPDEDEFDEENDL